MATVVMEDTDMDLDTMAKEMLMLSQAEKDATKEKGRLDEDAMARGRLKLLLSRDFLEVTEVMVEYMDMEDMATMAKLNVDF